MIIAKPKKTTLFSITAFLAIAFSIIGYVSFSAQGRGSWAWYHYGAWIVLGPIALGVMLRTLLNYKIVRIGQGKASVHYPLRGQRHDFDFKDLAHWQETSIGTASGNYKELEVHFNQGKRFSISLQEHSDYAKAVRYMKKKHPRKERKEPTEK